MSSQTMNNPVKTKGFKKVMKGLDMTLFTVCAILVMDTPWPVWGK